MLLLWGFNEAFFGVSFFLGGEGRGGVGFLSCLFVFVLCSLGFKESLLCACLVLFVWVSFVQKS